MNVRPLDTEWMKRADEIAQRVSKETESLVVLISIQEAGKLGVFIGGKERTGPEIDEAKRMMEDMGQFFAYLAVVCKTFDALDEQETRQ